MSGDEQTDSSGKYSMGGSGATGSAKYWPSILKAIELILAILCIGLIDDPANNSRTRVFISQRTVALSYATFGAFLIFSAVYIIGKIIRDHWPWKTSALLSVVGAILYLATCAMILKDWSNAKERNYWPPNTQSGCALLYPITSQDAMTLDFECATGFISLIACIIYIVDLILTVRAGSQGNLD